MSGGPPGPHAFPGTGPAFAAVPTRASYATRAASTSARCSSAQATSVTAASRSVAPIGVSAYSTRGGITGYMVRLTIPSTPQFTNTPGQVALSPSGTQLIVTTKANGNDIDVFGVGPGGRLSASPVVNAEGSTVPFAIAFDQAGHLVIANAGTNALSTFTLGSDGTVTLIDSAGTGQAATCWVARAGGTLYASNAGSANVSGYTSSGSGQLTLLGQTSTDPGTVDATAAQDGAFLYVQTGGNGIVDEFSAGTGGSLTSVGSVTVAGAAGGEGIAAS